MRWLVEVTSIGKNDRESFCVEAESWQRALQQTRVLRKETAPMSGFSIELLEEGCRAVDPMSRLRYEVKRTRDDAPLSAGAEAAAEKVAAKAPSIVPAPPAAPQAAAVPRPVSSPPPPKAPSNPPPAKKSVGKTTAFMGSGGGGAQLQQVSEPPKPAPIAPPPAAVPNLTPSAAPPPTSTTPSSQIIFKREEDPTDAVPLTYREYVFVVAQGTSESIAEAVLRAQLGQVSASIAAMPPGKLVQLAVFDVMFKGRPPVRPLATLLWKDWRGEPQLGFPRRPGYIAPVVMPPALVAAPPPYIPPPQPQPVAAPAPPLAPIADPATAAARGPNDTQPLAALTADSPAMIAAQATIAAPVIAQPAPPPVVVQAPIIVSAAPPPMQSAPPPMQSAPPPMQSAPPVAPEQGPPQQKPDFTRTMVDSQRPPSASIRAAAAKRMRGDELIAELFEVMHDLHFLRDAVDGAAFCLALALEKLPSELGVVHLYDIDRREFVVASTRGGASSNLLLTRYAESDPLLLGAMRKRRSVVIGDTSSPDTPPHARYATITHVKSMVIAPVMQSGRFLGAIEIVNPVDGMPFTEHEGNALGYIAEQLAEFVANVGVVTDPERITAAAQQPVRR